MGVVELMEVSIEKFRGFLNGLYFVMGGMRGKTFEENILSRLQEECYSEYFPYNSKFFQYVQVFEEYYMKIAINTKSVPISTAQRSEDNRKGKDNVITKKLNLSDSGASRILCSGTKVVLLGFCTSKSSTQLP